MGAPGAFATGGTGRGQRLQRWGPTNADVEVQEILQGLLKPVHYPIIKPWIATVGETTKKDLRVLARELEASAREMADQTKGYLASKEPLVAARNGRTRPAKAIHATPDRVQADFLKARSGTDQHDYSLKARRDFFQNHFSSIPSVVTVEDSHRLQDIDLSRDSTAAALTEEAKRKLRQWQVRGPARDRVAAAQVMRALRNISEAVTAFPTYNDFSKSRQGVAATITNLYDYSQTVGRGPRTFKPGMVPGKLRASMSAPLIFTKPPPYISSSDLESIPKPGGDVVRLVDVCPLQMLKNRHRASRSRVAVAGGNQDWTTTYESQLATGYLG